MHGSLIEVLQPLDLPGQVDHLVAGQHLTGAGLPAQPRREVERSSPIAAFDGDGLAGVQADADWEGKRRV